MEIEAFKISCRAIYPNCIFEHHLYMGLVARFDFSDSAEYSAVASINDGSTITDAKEGSVYVVHKTERECSPLYEFLEVSDESFLHELSKARKCR